MRFFVPLLVLVLLAGCVLTDEYGNPVSRKVVAGETVFEAVVPLTVVEKTLKALVKGSVYESGEQVSVFGTCLDGDDQPLNGTFASLSSWYPNGTVFFSNVSMGELQQGYYLYTGAMESVSGTYLTELTCHVNGSAAVARAFGEWQNPVWVGRINETQVAVANVSYNLQVLGQNVSDQFEITWGLIESVNTTINVSYTNLSQQIYEVGQIANNSVDRNDSYIVQLILNLTSVVTPPANGTLVNHTESADPPIYLKMWNIRVDAFDGSRQVSYPDVTCMINTTQTTTPVQMTVQGEHFVYNEKVLYPSGDFSWTVACYWL